MTARVHIDDLIPDFADFVGSTFDTKPALMAGAMRHRRDLLPSSSTIDSLLELDALPADQVRMTRKGRGLSHDSFTRMSARTGSPKVDRDKVMQLFRSGATLTINGVDGVWPAARAMVAVLGETFACQSEATIFATPAGRAGFNPHSDELGVLVVQAEGTKDWQVWLPDPAALRGRATFEAEDLGDPGLKVTLEPGDVLYLPHGTPHAAAATHEQSVHISLGLRPRGWQEIIGQVVAQVLDAPDQAAFPALTEDNIPALAGALAQHLATLQARLDKIDAEAVLRSFRTDVLDDLASSTSGGLAALRRLDACPTDQLFRVTDIVEVVAEADERCTLRVDGVTVTLPRIIASTLTAQDLADQSLTCRQIYPDAPVDRAMGMARQLARLGALTLVPAEG